MSSRATRPNDERNGPQMSLADADLPRIDMGAPRVTLNPLADLEAVEARLLAEQLAVDTAAEIIRARSDF